MDRCPRTACCRADQDITQCGDRLGPIGCPEPVEVNPAKDITLKCRPCGRTWSFPAADLLKGRTMPRCVGSTDLCKAVVVNLKAPAAKA